MGQRLRELVNGFQIFGLVILSWFVRDETSCRWLDQGSVRRQNENNIVNMFHAKRAFPSSCRTVDGSDQWRPQGQILNVTNAKKYEV